MKRLFITGGTGYLGRELVRQAQQHGWHVAASYYSQLPPRESALTWLPLDVRDAPVVEAVLNDFQPDVVIHTAYRQSEPGLWDVTTTGSHIVANAALSVEARLIHLSSDVIFNGEHTTPYTESSPPDPISDYGKAKAAAENAVRQIIPNAAIVRTSLTYGFAPIDRHTRFVLDVADGTQQAHLFTDEYRCPIFVGDLAAALLELSACDYQGVLNVAGGECLSRYEFGVLLAEAHGRDPSRIPAGRSSDAPVRRPRFCALDTRRATAMLRTRLRGVREVLQEEQPRRTS